LEDLLPVDLLPEELPLFDEELFPFSLELFVVAMICKISFNICSGYLLFKIMPIFIKISLKKFCMATH